MNSNSCQRDIHKEIHMYTKTTAMSAWPVLGAAVVACTLFAGNVAAKDHKVTVAMQVSSRGLDISRPAGAREFYTRIKHAAQIVCTHGMRVDLKPVTNEAACYEKGLGDAVRSVKSPLLTQVYLESHSSEQAAAYGINLPVQMAAK
jgi:UrcA family protein